MFDDVIRWLLMGLGSQTKAEKKWVEAHPLRLPTDDEQIRKARRVLEAAGNVDKAKAVALAGERPLDFDFGVYGLLSALPDDGGDA